MQKRHLLAHLLPLLPEPAVLLQRVLVVVVLCFILLFVDLGLTDTSMDNGESALSRMDHVNIDTAWNPLHIHSSPLPSLAPPNLMRPFGGAVHQLIRAQP